MALTTFRKIGRRSFMYAIIRTGGKQYKVAPGDVIRVEKVTQDVGSEIEFNEVLFVGGDNSAVGNPLVAKALVTGVVIAQRLDKKILVFKKKRRKGFRKTKGHRQPFSEVFVSAITGADGKTVKADKKPSIQTEEQKAERKMAKAAQPQADKPAKKVAAAGKKVTKKKTTASSKKKVSKKKKTTKK